MNKHAQQLGSLGGKSTSKKYGKKHFQQLQKKSVKARKVVKK
jgi:hypothetical protein